MTGTGIGNAFDLNAPKPLFAGTGKFVGGRSIPWANKSEAFAGVATTDRSEIGQLIAIGDIATGWVYYQFERDASYPIGGEDGSGWNLLIYLESEFGDKADALNLGVLSGTAWDIDTLPYAEKTISANTALTLSGGVSGKGNGLILIENSGSFTLTIDGDSVAIRDSGTTAISVIKKLNGTYYVSSDFAVTGPDTTPPTATFEATGVNTIIMSLNEPVTGTGSGITFDNGVALTIDSVVANSPLEYEFTIQETMTDADAITYEITSSDIEDLFGNVIEDTVTPGSVTNGIPTGYHADAITYFTAFAAAGGSYTDPEKLQISNGFYAADSAGIFSKYVGAWVQAGNVPAAAAINVVNPGTFDLAYTGSPTINDGYVGGTGKHAATGIHPDPDLTTSRLMGSVLSMDDNFTANEYVFGGGPDSTEGTPRSTLLLQIKEAIVTPTGKYQACWNYNSFTTPPNGTGIGVYTVYTNITTGAIDVMEDTTTLDTKTEYPGKLPDNEIYFGATNGRFGDPTIHGYTTRKMGVFAIGDGFIAGTDNAAHVAFMNALKTF